jgi:hypothetical protein
MPKKRKVSTSFPISSIAQDLLDRLATKTGLSRAGCLQLAIRELAARRMKL